MANAEDFKKFTLARLQTVDSLLAAQDWFGAAYMMALVLECALKASCCSHLELGAYPDSDPSSSKVKEVFMTHRFDFLLVVAGLSAIFTLTGNPEMYRNWSDFTRSYPADWPTMKYDMATWDETKIRALYANLTDRATGILTVIQKQW